MNFVDREVQFPNRFKVKEEDSTNQPVTVEIYDDVEKNSSDGTALTAAKLNSEFAKKQDVVSVTAPIKKEGNIIFCEHENEATYNQMFASRLQVINNNACSVDTAKWKLTMTEPCTVNLDDPCVKHCNTMLCFNVSNVVLDETHTDPAIIVRFDSSDATKVVTCRLKLYGGVEILHGSEMVVGSATDILDSALVSDFADYAVKIKVRRLRNGEQYSYAFECERDGLTRSVSLSTAMLESMNSVQIGSEGCTATISKWSIK